jgi:dihydrofolate reductase
VKPNTTIISDDIAVQITKLKNQDGGDILIFGSPGAAHSLMARNLIDEYWLFVNPIILGQGIPLFADVKKQINLRLISSQTFKCGVAALQYHAVR